MYGAAIKNYDKRYTVISYIYLVSARTRAYFQTAGCFVPKIAPKGQLEPSYDRARNVLFGSSTQEATSTPTQPKSRPTYTAVKKMIIC